MNLLLDALVKPSVVLLLALAVMPVLRHRSAALRHVVLAAALLCAAVVPFAGAVVPAWHVPGLRMLAQEPPAPTPRRAAIVTETVAVAGGSDVAPATAAGGARADERTRARAGGSILVWIWVLGSIPGLALLIAGVRRLVRLAATSQRIEHGAWARSAATIGREYGFRNDVTLLEAQGSNLLVTWGFFRPTVLLPAAAHDWSDDRVAIVLAHELAHIQRGDWAVLLMAEVLRAVYWFNPLFWIACARARQESETACDDRVLNRGVTGSDYAIHLVGIARALRNDSRRLPAPAITRTSSLEGRVKAMLDVRRNRRPLTRSAGVLTAVALFAVTVAVAGFAPGQIAFASLGGAIVDPQDALLPGVKVTLTNLGTEAKYEVKSDRTGRYEFVGLPPGEYALSAQLPGFRTTEYRVSMAGQNAERNLSMKIGMVEETISVTSGPPAVVDPAVQRAREERVQAFLAKRAEHTCSPAPADAVTRIGGNLRAPAKLKDVRPVYPAGLEQSGIDGSVLLEANIGTDGSVTNVDVISATHPDLAASAVEAVRQWQFDATLLNCVPVDVAMKVNISFQHRR
jgi:TonB family protein